VPRIASPQTFELSDSARRAIADPHCYIDGRWQVGSAEEARSFVPATGALLGVFRCASVEQVDAAIAAARRAFDRGSWARTKGPERARLLRRLAELMERDKATLTEIIVTDVGTPVTMAAPFQVGAAIEILNWFADAAERGPDGWYERALLPHLSTEALPSGSVLIREPIGVVAAMPTWNFPLTTVVWKLCAALAAGCTVVLQPSPKAVHSNMAFWRLLEQLDLPPGVANMVLGDVPVGQRLSASPLVDMLSFTGSAKVGALILAQAAPTLKKVVLELGGKSPNIILPGAVIAEVVKPSVDRWIGNAGQRCGATTRVLVHESNVDEFVAQADTYLKAVVVGDPRDRGTQMGPLIDCAHRDSVQGYVDRALQAGGRIVAGGGKLPGGLPGGAYMRPLLMGGLENDAEFCQEEQFGPVAAVLSYNTVDEAIQIANATKYGLNAMVFGPTVEAIAVGRQLRCGTVSVNGRAGARREAPWGGYGMSGLGREGGDDGLREFFEVKHLQWAMR
jgi:aldehyde dehydrogenase (NAD+)